MDSKNKIKCLLLVGPTGAGKTPLGRVLEERGFQGARVHHFDFGEELRKIASNQTKVSQDVADLVRTILAEGRLLTPEEYFIFLETLNEFIGRRGYKEDEFIVLNGFPRDLKQAEFIEGHLNIVCVINLSVTFDVLYYRLKHDPAGDRKGRTDDTPQLVAKKLAWFFERNIPLVEYYKQKGAKVLEIVVDKEDTGETLYQKLLSLLK
jgi:adenylate kinase family enzyme